MHCELVVNYLLYLVLILGIPFPLYFSVLWEDEDAGEVLDGVGGIVSRHDLNCAGGPSPWRTPSWRPPPVSKHWKSPRTMFNILSLPIRSSPLLAQVTRAMANPRWVKKSRFVYYLEKWFYFFVILFYFGSTWVTALGVLLTLKYLERAQVALDFKHFNPYFML